jgi:hypothetical protein
VVGFILISAWVPQSIENLINGNVREGGWRGGLALLLLVVGLIPIWFRKPSGNLEVREHPLRKSKAMAVYLSPLRRKIGRSDIENELSDDSKKLQDKFFAGCEWELIIEAIRAHQPDLTYLGVFTSSGSGGTHELMAIFNKVAKELFPELRVEELTASGVDFEDVKACYNCSEAFWLRTRGLGIKTSDAIIDISGGQKINSVAGAISSLVEAREFQYVSTNTHRIIQFDVDYFEEEETA